MSSSREVILSDVRAALGGITKAPAPVPAAARFPARAAGSLDAEIGMFLDEVSKLGGATYRITREQVWGRLEDLVTDEAVKKATLWQTPDLEELGIAEMLGRLGVEVVPPTADKRRLAECDLGITGADAALPETGTLLLRSSSDKPRAVSLIPRVHLAIVSPSALRADIHQALAEVKGESFVFVTGPSRTADIELTLTIGVHGPKALYVWVVE